MTNTIALDRNLALDKFGLSANATTQDAALFQNWVAGLIAAIQAAMAAQQRRNGSSFERGGWQSNGNKSGAPTDFSNRTLPEITGANGCDKAAANMKGHGRTPNGAMELANLIVQQLFGACPPKDKKTCGTSEPTANDSPCTPADMMPTPTDGAPVDEPASPCTPTDCAPTDGAPTDCAPADCAPETPVAPETPIDPETPGEPEANKKVFVVGDLVHFGRGDGTVRSGLQQLLDAATKPNKKGQTKLQMPAEDVERLQKLLTSTDPEAQATLKTKVPKKQSLVIGEDGKILSTVDTRSKIMANQSLNVAQHTGNRVDRSVGGQLELDGQTYDVAGTELHSPIKIALDGKDAKLNGTNGFKIDLDGFDTKGGVIKTSGGLNGNEAWLVRDRERNGVVKNGVVDGNDVYGDHSGKRKDGYDDLARDFASELKTDPRTGKRYLDLTAPGSRAAQELQLLDASGKLRPAREVMTRIDVDGTQANERDARGNVITARGQVTYQDGHTASSADQWFRAL